MPLLVLAVDDDRRMLTLLERLLQKAGFAVATAVNGTEVRRQVKLAPPDLVLLDLMLPQEDGISLARELRQTCGEVPIIFVSGKTDTLDKVLGLEIGADDYITKPFDERELLARIRSVLRRVQTVEDRNPQRARFGDWTCDLRSHQLTHREQGLVHLTGHEYQLLILLLRHKGQTLSRDTLLEALSQTAYDPLDRRIDVLVGKLRRKLEGGANSPSFIKTVRGVGYRFTGLVTFDS